MSDRSRSLELSSCVVDLDVRQVRRGSGEDVRLTPKEAALLRYLAERPGCTVSRDTLLREVWGYAAGVASRAPDLAVHSLRRKVEDDARTPSHIVTEYGEGWRFVPPAAPAAVTGSPLIGRDALLADVVGRLEGGSRVMTLVGSPGIGKTALARVIAHGLRGRGLVWECDLTTARTLPELVQAVANSLDVPASHGPRAVDRIGHALAAAGAAWLVLDDCESLRPEARAAVERWLELAPELGLLATSRERMWWRGEEAVEVGPLRGDDAVALLRDRARAAGAAEPGTPAELGALAGELDGVPLAIELAASRLPHLGVAGLRAALADRFAVLATRAVGPRPRHATLHGAIDASWALLDPRERSLFARLSAFPAIFDVRGARAVGGAAALTTLLGLVDRSLVSPRGGDPATFVLLRSLRAYAASHLDDAARDEAWSAHADFALSDHGTTADLLAVVDRSDVIDATLVARAALTLAGRNRRVSSELGAAVLERTLSHADAVDARVRCEVHIALAACLVALGRRDEALAHLADLALDTPDLGAVAALTRASALLSSQDYVGASEAYREATEIAELAGDEFLATRALRGAGRVAMRLGQLPRALELFERSQARALAAGDDEGVVRAALNIGEALLDTADEAGAEAALDQVFLRAQLSRSQLADALMVTGLLRLGQGRLDEAVTTLTRALSTIQGLGEPYQAAIAHHNLAHALLERGDVDAARVELERAMGRFASTGSHAQLGMSSASLGLLHHLAGDGEAAEAAYREAARRLDPTGARVLQLAMRSLRAVGRARSGDEAGARADVESVRELLPQMSGPLPRALAEMATASLEPARTPVELHLNSQPLRARSLLRTGLLLLSR